MGTQLRRSDVISLWILGFCSAIWVIGVLNVAAQTIQDTWNATFTGELNLVKYRLDKLETLIYASVAGTGGNLLAHITEIRKRRESRR